MMGIPVKGNKKDLVSALMDSLGKERNGVNYLGCVWIQG
jgi:hypothetical protein